MPSDATKLSVSSPSSSSAPTSPPSGVHTDLKQSTRTLHKELDSSPQLVRLLSHDLSLAQYAGILRLYAQIYPWMETILAQAESVTMLDGAAAYQARYPSICRDLKALDAPIPPAVLTPVAIVATLDSSRCACYWGLRYVLEGASQGAKFIAARLSRNLPELQSTAFAFWNVQAVSAQRWPEFCQRLDRLDFCERDREMCLSAARQAFLSFIVGFNDGQVISEAT